MKTGFLSILFIASMIADTVLSQFLFFILLLLTYTKFIALSPKIFPSKSLFALMILTLCFHLFVRFETLWFEAFYTNKIYLKSAFFTLRNAVLFLSMTQLLNRVTKNDLSSILADFNEKLKIKGMNLSLFIQPLIIALLYKDIIRDEFKSMKQLYRILGIRSPRKIAPRIKWYSTMILPLIAASFERSEHLAVALTSRGFSIK
ncbi:MAG: hypothetical protein KAI81_00655 [Candidatus Marinimicrobia bacterium]|nr:hypothetical protein [Candidatus Neomarinimicrobiota bacterium]